MCNEKWPHIKKYFNVIGMIFGCFQVLHYDVCKMANVSLTISTQSTDIFLLTATNFVLE